MMSTADFYHQSNGEFAYLGSLFVGGSQAAMHEAGLFASADGSEYTDTTFVLTVKGILADAIADDAGSSFATGDPWPWPHRSSVGTEMAYVYDKGSIRVFERGQDEHGRPGQFLAAVHYPNGARRPTPFPEMI